MRAPTGLVPGSMLPLLGDSVVALGSLLEQPMPRFRPGRDHNGEWQDIEVVVSNASTVRIFRNGISAGRWARQFDASVLWGECAGHR